MLLLLAASGIVFWEARRRTRGRKALKGRAAASRPLRKSLASFVEPSSPEDRSPSANGGAWLARLKHQLSALSPDASSTNPELLASVLREGEGALPELCNLLKASTNDGRLADAAELLALLSPSRRGLQAAICDSGAVPPLLRLLANAAPRQPPPPPSSAAFAEPSFRRGTTQHLSLTQIPIWVEFSQCSSAQHQIRERDPEKGHRIRRVESAGGAVEGGYRGVGISSSSFSASDGSASGCGSASGLSCADRENAGVAGAALTDPIVLSYVLRTLVNLTSNTRTGNPVRQALLRDSAAMDALMALLRVPEDDDAAWQGGSGCCDATAAAAAAAGGQQDPAAAGAPSLAARWHSAGLAAWLVAHLCSASVGQLQLVQEGVVPALVRLVRHGRTAWAAAAAEAVARSRASAEGAAAAAVAGSGQATGGRTERAAAAAAATAARDQAPYTRTAGGLLPHASSTLLYDAAAAAAAAAAGGGGSPRAAAVPYMVAAVQYGLMALVNITFDNSSNQRAVARAGMLAELEALFSLLLHPGILLPLPPPPPAWPTSPSSSSSSSCGGVAACGSGAMVAAVGAAQLQRRRTLAGAGPEEVEEVATGGGGEGGGDGDGGRSAECDLLLLLLLRSGYLGVAKFAVWLLAHLSSSDPDLKADIAGPAFSFVPRLLDFLLLPDADAQEQQQQPQQPQEQPQGQGPGEPTRPTGEWHSADVPCAAAPAAAGGDGNGGGGGSNVAAANGGVLVVRQYAAMALVNLTCGVPATKAAVARAMDWDGMAALLQWLAEETERANAAATGAAAAAAAAGNSAPAAAGATGSSSSKGGGGPVSDLLLYTVWLLQHLSLSPFAAAAADPRVVPPLVSLLDAPDAHVRLRASAAIGALCSASLPPGQPTAAGAGAGAAGGAPQPQQPHRAAFLAAGGVQRLLAAARRERDPHLLAYGMLCLSSGVGDDNVAAVAEAVAGGALRLLEALMVSEHAACLLPAAEALQALARAARSGMRRHGARARGVYGDSAAAAASAASAEEAAAAAAVAAAADYLPRSLLSRVVAVMLTHSDPGVRVAMNEALGAVTALPGVRDRYCAVFAETLRDLVSAAEVELQVIPVN